jgi:toxin ParE1/3/4
LEDIVSYISADNPRAALWVAQRIEKRVADLADFPDSGRMGRGAIRELVITQTPYIAMYRHRGDLVEIVRITHGARDR